MQVQSSPTLTPSQAAHSSVEHCCPTECTQKGHEGCSSILCFHDLILSCSATGRMKVGKTNNTPCPHISQTLSYKIQLSRSCSHHRHPQALNHIFLSVPSPICFILQQPQSSHSPCLAQLLQRWQHPHLPTPALFSSCSLDKAITPLRKQFMIIQKGATAFETNTFQITVDGL